MKTKNELMCCKQEENRKQVATTEEKIWSFIELYGSERGHKKQSLRKTSFVGDASPLIREEENQNEE
jgi:hypothetical protein